MMKRTIGDRWKQGTVLGLLRTVPFLRTVPLSPLSPFLPKTKAGVRKQHLVSSHPLFSFCESVRVVRGTVPLTFFCLQTEAACLRGGRKVWFRGRRYEGGLRRDYFSRRWSCFLPESIRQYKLSDYRFHR